MKIPTNDFHFEPDLFEQMRVDIWQCFLRQYEQKKMCDVMIRCGDNKFYSHRCVLSAISPYYKLMFSSEYCEYSQSKDNYYFVSDLSDFPANCVHFLLDFIYQKPDIDSTFVDLLEFLKLLDYLQIKDFRGVFEKVVRQNIDISNCFKVLEVADTCRSSKLAKVALAFITSNIKEVLAATDFSDVSEYMILLCLHSETFQYVTDKDAVSLIKTWIQAHDEESESMQDLLVEKSQRNTLYESTSNNLDLILHYGYTSEHAMLNSIENKEIGPFLALKELPFLQERYNQLRMSSHKLLFFNNHLYLAAVFGEEAEATLILAKYLQEKGAFDVRANQMVKQYGKCDVHKGPLPVDVIDVIEVVGMHCHSMVMYIALALWCCKSCYVLPLDMQANHFRIDNPILIDVTEILHFDFTAHKNIIFVKDSYYGYCYDADTKVLKKLTLSSMVLFSPRFFKGKIIGMCHLPEDGLIKFSELSLADGFWKHLSRVPLPELSIEDQDWFGYHSARHFIHNKEFFIEIPPQKNKEERFYQYRNVDFGSNCLGNYVLEFRNGDLTNKDFLSLPSWILH